MCLHQVGMIACTCGGLRRTVLLSRLLTQVLVNPVLHALFATPSG